MRKRTIKTEEMVMTGRDYQLVADAIRSVWERSAGTEKFLLAEVINELSWYFSQENKKFDPHNFQVACTGN